MFESEAQKVSDYRKARVKLSIVLVVIKLVIAYLVIEYIDFGLYIVIGYILYSLENLSGLQMINSQETNLQFNILRQRIEELEREL